MTHDLSRFDSDARTFVEILLEHGWTGRLTSKGDFLAKAPDGVSLTVPKRMRSGHGRNGDKARATFKRWLDAHRDEFAVEMESMELANAAIDAALAGETVLADTLAAASQRRFNAREIVPAPTPEEEPMPEPTLVSVEPWLARKSPNKHGGTLYHSTAVLEMTYSDGSTMYKCASPGCDFRAAKPRSVASHYGKGHTAKGEAPARQDDLVPGVDYTEPTTTRDYQPTDRLLKALADYLAEFATDVMGVDALAEVFLRWAHDRPDLDGIESEPVRPLTDAEIIGRIRNLVGQPLAVDLDRTRDALTEAQAARDAAIAERDAVTARLAAVERDLTAAADLIARIGRE